MIPNSAKGPPLWENLKANCCFQNAFLRLEICVSQALLPVLGTVTNISHPWGRGAGDAKVKVTKAEFQLPASLQPWPEDHEGFRSSHRLCWTHRAQLCCSNQAYLHEVIAQGGPLSHS